MQVIEMLTPQQIADKVNGYLAFLLEKHFQLIAGNTVLTTDSDVVDARVSYKGKCGFVGNLKLDA